MLAQRCRAAAVCARPMAGRCAATGAGKDPKPPHPLMQRVIRADAPQQARWLARIRRRRSRSGFAEEMIAT